MNERPAYASPPCWQHEIEDAPPQVRWKRVYEAPSKEDGFRVLIDRLWPRGLKKQDLELDAWMKEIAPSPALRQWFGHRAERWEEFRRRYRAELDHGGDALRPLIEKVRETPVTLLIAAKDPAHNHAVVLVEYLRKAFR